MSIEKREQVFVSSTFKDLVEERAAVIHTLLEADCIPSGMELFPATDDDKFDLIKRVIDLGDYYVVIVGGRYGSVDPVEELSYTEMEFDYAVKMKKPVMAFLHGNPGALTADKTELDPELRKKLDVFRGKAEKKVVKYWTEPGDLKGQVALAIIQIRKSHPAEGWIRAGEAMTPEVKAELAELRAKVRELSADLKDEKRQHESIVDPADLVQGESVVALDCKLAFHWQSTIDEGKAHEWNRNHGRWTVRPTWNEVFRHLAPDLMDEASEEYLRQRLSALCDRMSRDDLLTKSSTDDKESEGDEVDGELQSGAGGLEEPNAEDEANDERDEDDDDDIVARIYETEVTIESFNDTKVQFVALGLIENGTRRRPGSDTNTYWRLTQTGRELLIRLRAIRKPATTTPISADA